MIPIKPWLPLLKFKFTIRLALVITTISCSSLAPYAYRQHLRQQRLDAIVMIERDSGHVVFRNSEGLIPLEATVKVRLGDCAERIYLASTDLKLDTLESLCAIAEARFLSFNNTSFADCYVSYLDENYGLQELQLNGTCISKTGLLHLAQHHRLVRLSLNDTDTSDDSLDALLRMKSLRSLELFHTRLSIAARNRLKSELPDCVVLF